MKASDILVVFLPGIFSSAEFVFDGSAKFLQEKGYRTAFLEYPFKEKGMRQWPDLRITRITMPMLLDKCRESLDAVIRENQDARIYLVGHSLGAAVALCLAGTLEMKSRISGVAAICPAPLDGMNQIPLNWKRLISFWPGLLSEALHRVKINLPVYRTFRGARRVALPKELPLNDLKRIWKQMRWESLPVLQALYGLHGHRPPFVNFKDIACKVNIICGSEDELVPLSVPKELNEKIPESECYVLRSSHYPFWGEPGRQFNNIMLNCVSA